MRESGLWAMIVRMRLAVTGVTTMKRGSQLYKEISPSTTPPSSAATPLDTSLLEVRSTSSYY